MLELVVNTHATTFHSCIWRLLCCVRSIGSCLTIYLFAWELLLLLLRSNVINTSAFLTDILWVTCRICMALVSRKHPWSCAMELVTLVNDCLALLLDDGVQMLHRLAWVIDVALVHLAGESVIVALKAVTEHIRLLLSLISNSYHLTVLMMVRCSVSLLFKLSKVYGLLRLIDELARHLIWVGHATRLATCWLLRGSSRLSCRMCSTLVETIFGHALNQRRVMRMTWSFHLKLLELKLLLDFHLLLLLGRKIVPAIQDLLLLIALICHLRRRRNSLNSVCLWRGLLNTIWVWILPREEPCLCLTFSAAINHSSFWCGTFRFREMHDVLETVCLCINLLVRLMSRILLLLALQGLLELHLLLELLLFIRQDWVLWLLHLSCVCNCRTSWELLLLLHSLSWPHDSANEVLV